MGGIVIVLILLIIMFGAISNGDYGVAVFVFLFFVLVGVMSYFDITKKRNKKFKKNNAASSKNDFVQIRDANLRRIVTDSLQIVETTKNIETFLSRYDLLLTTSNDMNTYTPGCADELIGLLNDDFEEALEKCIARIMLDINLLKTDRGRLNRLNNNIYTLSHFGMSNDDYFPIIAKQIDRLKVEALILEKRLPAATSKATGKSTSGAKQAEHDRVAYESTKIAFSDYFNNGTKFYQVLATLDLSTCKQCADLDGKIFEVTDGKIGVNCPPFHSGCRCCTTPYVIEMASNRGNRAARDPITHKTVSVPYMTYWEWHEKYVKK